MALESRVWDVSMVLYDPHAAIIVESPCHRWPFMLQLIHNTFLYMDILIWKYIRNTNAESPTISDEFNDLSSDELLVLLGLSGGL